MFLKSKKGQSALEIAILGSLILICFSYILSYGQRLNFEQQLRMEAFRKAIQRSYYKNAPVSYTLYRDSRFADLFSGYGRGQPTASSATAAVMWTKGMAGIQNNTNATLPPMYEEGDKGVGISHSFYEINDQIYRLPKYPKRVVTLQQPNTPTSPVETPVVVYLQVTNKTESYNSQVSRLENATRIINFRQANLSETVNTTLLVRYDTSTGNPGTQPPWYNRYYNESDYVYQGDIYIDYNNENYTIEPGPQVTQNATLEQESQGNTTYYINRVIYKSETSGPIQRRRTWTTQK